MKKNWRKKKRNRKTTRNSIYNAGILKKHAKLSNQWQKATINTKMLKNVNRPHNKRKAGNDKMIDRQRKTTKPRTKRANNGIKETYYRKTSRQATKQPEAHVDVQNRQNQYSPAGTSQKKHRSRAKRAELKRKKKMI